MPLLFEALTNSRPTGYNEAGECVRKLTARERAMKVQEEERVRARRSVARLGERYHAPSSAPAHAPAGVEARGQWSARTWTSDSSMGTPMRTSAPSASRSASTALDLV